MAEKKPGAGPKKSRKAHEATVTGRRQLSADLVRLSLNAPDFVGKELQFTDHYIKLLFVPADADYAWPFDAQQIREEQPRDKQPITRTYTIFNLNPETGVFVAAFVSPGAAGLVGPMCRE